MDMRKSVTWEGPKKLLVKDLKIPRVKQDQILVKVKSCAICGSDIRIFNDGHPRVKSGQIIGHEASGKIEIIGKNVTKFKVGDRVSIGADVPCGQCIHCMSNRANCCDTNYAIGHQFEGGFTQYMLLNSLTVKLGPISRLNHDIDYDIGALGEPLACCINGFERSNVKNGSNIIIFGAGPIGLILGKLAEIYKSKRIIIIDPQESRLNTANKILKKAYLVKYDKCSMLETVKTITEGLGGDFIFTACSSIEAQHDAIEMVAKRGVINFFGGLPPNNIQKISFFSNLVHYKEACITGSHGSTPLQHKKAVDMINIKKIELSDFITHKYNICDIDTAYQVASSGNAIKVIIKPNDNIMRS